MTLRPSFALLFLLAALGSGTVVACLNPQPLPPATGDDDDDGDSQQRPDKSGTSSGGEITSSSSTSSSGGYQDPNPASPADGGADPSDAGADADAAPDADPQ